MRAVAIERFGGPDVLDVREVDAPVPRPGEVRVRVGFAGVNYIDVYMRSGIYARSATYQSPLPMVLGMEGAGVVDALGDGVHDVHVGQSVAWCIVRGAYADQAIVPAWRLVPVPAGVPLDVACALMLQGSTAHSMELATTIAGNNRAAVIGIKALLMKQMTQSVADQFAEERHFTTHVVRGAKAEDAFPEFIARKGRPLD